MRIFSKFIVVYIITTATLISLSLENKYPSYNYVFNEFDVDDSYLYNEEFKRFVDKNERGLKQFYKRSLVRGETLLPMLQGLLMEDGVSDLFIYLSMIESGFSTDIVSSKKAVGLWQFMPATARQYNLTVCKNYDERCDATSATTAAMKYLNKLHKQFGKWYLAAMAYNCGEGRLERAIKKAGTDDLSILTNNQNKFLPKETRDYIRKILLIAMIGESSIIGFDNVKENNNGFVEVEVDRSTSIQAVAKMIKMDKQKLLSINKHYTKTKPPTQKPFYTLKIPMEKIYAFYLRYEIPEVKEAEPKSHMITHEVQMGDTLDNIAKLYDANKDEIRVVNHLEYPFLQLNTLLVIPVSQNIFEKMSR